MLFLGNFCAVNNEQELIFAIDKAASNEHDVYALATGLDAELVSSSLKISSY